MAGMEEFLKAVRPFARVDDATWAHIEKHVLEFGVTGAAGNVVQDAVEKAGRSEAGRKAALARWGNRSGGSANEEERAVLMNPGKQPSGRGKLTREVRFIQKDWGADNPADRARVVSGKAVPAGTTVGIFRTQARDADYVAFIPGTTLSQRIRAADIQPL